jgi:hypothetical protein
VRVPTEGDIKELLRWRPPDGVISVYLDLRPEDRGEPWRIELRNGLAAARDAAEGHGRALEATAERIERRLAADRENPSGRIRIGFAEVAVKPGREEWFAVQGSLPQSEIAYASQPVLAPLAATLDGHEPRGVVVVSSERVRLLWWSLAGLETLAEWGLEIFSLDWRERKAQRSSDPAQVQGAKASGRDQFDQRLEANRQRFLHEAGRLAAAELAERDCAEILAFGEPEHVRALADGAGSQVTVRGLEPHNLISEPPEAIGGRVEGHLAELRREREAELLQRVEAELGMDGRAALGGEAVRRSLREGRVEHLLVDAAADGVEQLVEAALETSASVTRVHDGSGPLGRADGLAALLRY